MSKVVDGQTYELALKYGTWSKEQVDELRRSRMRNGGNGTDVTEEVGDPIVRTLRGTVRVFKQDGRTLYELQTQQGTDEPCPTCHGSGTVTKGVELVGFLPENVLSATDV